MNDLFAGACGGLVQVILGHPLDTLKILLQNNLSFKNLKIKDYYKGAKFQLPYAITKNGIIFPSYYFAKKHTDSDLLAGSFAGLMTTPSQYFFDVNKIKRPPHRSKGV